MRDGIGRGPLVPLVWSLMAAGTMSAQESIPPASPPEIRALTHHRATDHHAVFSPSGREILFASRDGGVARLFRVPFEGGEPVEVPIGLTGDLYSDWHPDGKSIVFDARHEGGPPDLYRYWLNSGEVQRLTDDPGMDGQPSISPDGRRLVFTSMRAGNPDLWIMELAGGTPVQLTHDPRPDWHPQWCPAGRRILFTSSRDGDPDLWLIGVDGTGLRKLTSLPGTEDRGHWSPDGSRVVFQWEGDLWVVGAEGGDPKRLTGLPGREGGPAWSPDGRSIVFGDDRSGQINLSILTLDGREEEDAGREVRSGGAQQRAGVISAAALRGEEETARMGAGDGSVPRRLRGGVH